LDKFNIVVAPLLNPDGYEYSRTTNRFWRKNRTKNKDGSVGTDLNRNWGEKWGFIGASQNPISDIYCGRGPESEPEVKNVVRYIMSLNNRAAGLDVHSYGQKVLRNYGYTMADTADEELLRPISDSMAAKASGVHGSSYGSQKSAALYPTGGGMDDWFYLRAGIHGFTIELRDTGRYGFELPPNQIIQTGDELAEIVKSLLSNLK
jgi:murein tripeptide amidase MpaA